MASDLLGFMFMLAVNVIYGKLFCYHCKMKLVHMALAINQNSSMALALSAEVQPTGFGRGACHPDGHAAEWHLASGHG